MEQGIDKLIGNWPRFVVADRMDCESPLVIYDSMYKMLVGGGVKLDTSPGYPGMLLGKTNADVIGFLSPETVAAIAAERVLLINEISFEFMETLSAVEMVKLGLTDPIRVFIKNEPHSKAKLELGRLRIINSVSLIDQMVEKYFCGRQNKLEIANFVSIPCMPGMGNHDGVAGAQLTARLLSAIKSRSGTDARAYDWTNTHQTMMVDARFRAKILGLPKWENVYTKRQLLLMTSVMIVDNGNVFQQSRRGVQKSGSVNTSTGNCRSRVVARAVAFPDMDLLDVDGWQVRVMGDDGVENTSGISKDEVVSAYQRLNVLIKEVTTLEEDGFVEFCGLEYSEMGIHNPRSLKSLVHFLYTWPTEAQWESRFEDFKAALVFCPLQCEYYCDLLLLVKQCLTDDE